MRELAKRCLTYLYLDDWARDLRRSFRLAVRRLSWQSKRRIGRLDEKTIRGYFEQHTTRKLHIGCGYHTLDTWLNSDYFPESAAVIHLDATKPFPFDDGVFDYVFSQHMIEHIPFPAGMQMLAECHRVLKENGRIRLSTPDLSFVVDLHRHDKTDLQQQYIKWATDTFIKGAPYYGDAFVINNFVRDWDHAFIYDENTLRYALEQAGFTKITRCSLNESEHAALRALENESRMPEGFLRLETITMEGVKSGPGK
jgi:predicted SAM-dependent methyltransferase